MSKLKQRTFEDGQEIVRQLKRSGLSQEKFATTLGISAAVVGYWVRRIRKLKRSKQKPNVRFVEVTTSPMSAATPSSIELPGGLVLKTSALPNPNYLVQLSTAYLRGPIC